MKSRATGMLVRAASIAAVCALAAFLCAGRAAVARADDASESNLHWELGRSLYGQARYTEALDHFLASNRLAPNRHVVFDAAQTYRLLDRPREAYNWFETYLRDFELTAEERAEAEALQAQLAPTLALVEVSTTPPGAQIFVDRRELGSVGRAPRRVAMEVGDHQLLVELAGYHPTSTSVRAALGTTTATALTLAPILGRVEVRSEPLGAQVRTDDGRVLGVTPLSVELPIGSRHLEVALDGFVEQSHVVVVRESGASTLDIRLQRAASDLAILTVEGAPAGAAVRLVDRRLALGALPLTRDDLRPGPTDLEISAAGRAPYRTRIVLEAGAATRVDVTLEPPSHWFWQELRWVAWGSAAALYAASGVTGVLALDARQDFFARPTREDYDSTQRFAVASDALLIAAVVVAAASFILELVLEPPPASRARVTMQR